MNVPNKLTVLRMCLIPFYVVFVLVSEIPHHLIWALGIFIVASLTDMVDGKLARKNNQVTTFGKFLDPLADKLLVTAALLCFIEQGLISSVPVLIIIAREFLVTSVRLIAAGEGKVVAANIWGKMKTVSQIIVICGILLSEILIGAGILAPETWGMVYTAAIWLVTLITVLSGITYFWENRALVNATK